VRKGDNVLVDLHRRALLPSLDYATPCSAIRMGIAPRVHSFGHGHRQVRADRRGAPSILCRDDTREGTSLPDSTAEVLSNPAASFRQWPRHRSALALFAGRRNDAVYPDGRIDGTLASDDPGLQAPVSIDIGAQLCGMELNASRPRSASRSRIRSSPCRAKISATVAMLPSTPAMPPSAPHRCVTSDSSRLLRSRDGATLRPAIDRDQRADDHEQQHLQRLALRRRLARQVASTHRR